MVWFSMDFKGDVMQITNASDGGLKLAAPIKLCCESRGRAVRVLIFYTCDHKFKDEDNGTGVTGILYSLHQTLYICGAYVDLCVP
mgnify:CR=1 FL=1